MAAWGGNKIIFFLTHKPRGFVCCLNAMVIWLISHRNLNISGICSVNIMKCSNILCLILARAHCHASLSGLFPLQLWCSAVGAANRRGTLQRDRWTRCRLWSRRQQAHPAHPFHVPRTFCAAHVRWYTPAEM